MGRHRQCDGVTRRDAIRVGMLGMCGASMSGLTVDGFQRMAEAGQIRSNATAKSAIFVELAGGPSHIDTFDLKQDSEVRGPFRSIKTNVSGVEFCEHLPRLAKCADKFAILRGVSHSLGAHALGQKFIFTGNRPTPSFEYPALGAVAAKELVSDKSIPGYVAIPKEQAGPGHLGVKFAALSTNAMPKVGKPFYVRGFQLNGALSLEEIGKRQNLLRELDTKFETVRQHDDLIGGLDKFSQEAFDMITSRQTRTAFDISKEAESYQKLFGQDDFSQSCMLATRLVASGVRFVTVSLGGWDTHQDNFTKLKDNLLPRLDAGLAGLFTGLEQKGLLESTTVYVTGEFGRTPKINTRSAEGGRDHYPRCMFMLMGGGGIRGGQVLGASDAKGAGPEHEGFKPEDVATSFYHSLGIDHHKEYHTSVGRPVHIVRDGQVIDALFSG